MGFPVAMRSVVLAILLALVAIACAQQQTNGFLPPSALATESDVANVSPQSPVSTVQLFRNSVLERQKDRLLLSVNLPVVKNQNHSVSIHALSSVKRKIFEFS